jgi:peptidoglycan/xylan/chitin deacetylase (PgdA/CDA1 family)
LLTREDAAKLIDAGFSIGFHTRRHHPLPHLGDADLMAALSDGRERLAAFVGSAIDAIAYPHGTADERVADAAHRAGFRLGFTVRRAASTASTDELLIPRLEVSECAVGAFSLDIARALSGAGDRNYAGKATYDRG